jgi:hypothetical protein
MRAPVVVDAEPAWHRAADLAVALGADVGDTSDAEGKMCFIFPMRPPSEGIGIMTVSWLYHVSSVPSTPPQAGPGSFLSNCGNCLQINCKKCIFLCYGHMSQDGVG